MTLTRLISSLDGSFLVCYQPKGSTQGTHARVYTVDEVKIRILRQVMENLNINIFLCPLFSPLPSAVYRHYAWTRPPHWRKYLLNHKERHSPVTHKTTP